MTIAMFNAVTREQLSRLHPLTRQEFMAHAKNQICAITLHADNIAAGRGDSISAALAIAKCARKWQADLEQLFGDTETLEPPKKNPDAHLGAQGE